LLPFNLKDPDDVGLSTLAYVPPGYLLYVRGQTLMAQPIDLGQFRLSGPAVPIAEGVEKIGPGSAAFSVSNTGVLAYWAGTGVQSSQLAWRGRDGTVLGPIGAPGGYTGVVLSPDERRIATSRVDPGKQSAIWILDVTRGTSMKVSFDPVSIEPIWSPDSGSLVFGSARDGPPSLIQKTVTGEPQDVVLLKSNHGNAPTDWCAAPSPARSGTGVGGHAGGGTILFQSGSAQTRSDIWALPLTGDRKPIPMLQTLSSESDARCSPDGRWLAYTSDESGRDEVYVTSFPTPGGKWPISTSGGTQPQWRRDGTELFYVGPDRTVTAVRVAGGSTFEAGAVTPLFKIRGNAYAASADGRRFVTDDPIGEASFQPITVVLNWPSGLKK
jgi:dipeptidyl aminopeptidase/acylaminoacyl peptidase